FSHGPKSNVDAIDRKPHQASLFYAISGEARRPRSVRSVFLIVAIGLCACLILASHEGLTKPPKPGSDASEYDSYAWSLAQGRGYSGISPEVKKPDGQVFVHPTAYRVPGTSVFWAGLYWTFGHRYDVVRIAQCTLVALTIWFVYGIGVLCFNRVVALLAAGVYAVWPAALF